MLLGRIADALRDDLSTIMVGVPYREACNPTVPGDSPPLGLPKYIDPSP